MNDNNQDNNQNNNPNVDPTNNPNVYGRENKQDINDNPYRTGPENGNNQYQANQGQNQGQNQQNPYSNQGYYNPNPPPYQMGYNYKSKVAAGLLGIFLGSLGVHNFYLGNTGKAVTQLLLSILSCGILATVSGIWGLIEGILILTGSIAVDGKNMPLRD